MRCALEVDDSGETRAEKIIRLIRDSRFGIHDISRTELNAEGLPRFNMPYEFGMFIGFRYGGVKKQKRKAILVLDREPYRYQRYLSDIAGQDIKSHRGNFRELIAVVRNWLQSYSERRKLPGVEYLIRAFDRFRSEVPALLAAAHQTDADLKNFRDQMNVLRDWISFDSRSGPR